MRQTFLLALRGVVNEMHADRPESAWPAVALPIQFHGTSGQVEGGPVRIARQSRNLAPMNHASAQARHAAPSRALGAMCTEPAVRVRAAPP